MLSLVLQTVFPEIQVLVLNKDLDIVDSLSWKSEKDEVKKIMPAIESILNRNNDGWKDLEKIFITVGTGSFSSTRIGVTIANTLAATIDCQLFEITLENEISLEELAKKVKEESAKEPVKLAKPVYKSAPMISPTKKKQFT